MQLAVFALLVSAAVAYQAVSMALCLPEAPFVESKALANRPDSSRLSARDKSSLVLHSRAFRKQPSVRRRLTVRANAYFLPSCVWSLWRGDMSDTSAKIGSTRSLEGLFQAFSQRVSALPSSSPTPHPPYPSLRLPPPGARSSRSPPS